MKITRRRYERFRDSIEELISRYREEFSLPVTTDWKEYELLYRQRMRGIATELRGMIDFSSNITMDEYGRHPLLDAREKVFIILVKEVFRLSNRKVAYLLPLLGIEKEISYKTVERLYSDPLVLMILNNLFVSSINRKCIHSVDASGDGTGYSLTVTKHYRSMREKDGEFVKDEKVHSFLFAKDFPFEIDSKFKAKVTGESENVGQIIRVHPIEENIAWNIITREFGRRTLRLINHEKINDRNVESNKMTVQSIQNIKEEVASGRSKLLKFSGAYFLMGEPGVVLPAKKELLHLLRKIGVRAENKRYSDAKVRNKIIGGQLEGVYLDPDSVSNLVPINRGYLFHEKGTFYGTCEISKAPIFLDRSVFPSSHQLVLGMTGFGKSFFVKATMLREKVTRRVNIKIIDPLGEYVNLAKSLGIQTIDLLNQEMNVFERVGFLSLKENVDRTLALLLTLFDLDNKDSGVLDTGLTKMYENNESLEFLKNFVKSQTPDTYNKISPIFEGSLKKFCTGRNPNLTGDLQINLKNVPKKLLSFYMLLSLDLLMRSDERIPSNLVIDEAHYLLQERVVNSVERYIRHARHSNVSMIFISQSANDFLKRGPATTIMENCSIHILFRHQMITDDMIKFYSLDESLSNFLRVGAGFNGSFSTALFFSPGFTTILRFQSNKEEMERVDGIPKG